MQDKLHLMIVSSIILATSLSTSATQPYGLGPRSPAAPFLDHKLPPRAPGEAGVWTTVKAFPNLTFQDPTFLLPEPGTDRLFVGGREGYIWTFINNPDTSRKSIFLDLHHKTQGWDDCGMLGMAFHPEYGRSDSKNRGYIYVYYQYTTQIVGSESVRPPLETPAYNRLSRFTVPPGSLVADPDSELILINQFDRHVWHNGGGMFFGPDGFLYLSNGDEGGPNDYYGQTQRIDRGLFSGVLRIDVDQDGAKSHPIRRQPLDGGARPAGWPGSYSANYYIPNDNPFINPDGGVLEEFYAIGLRSPHRMTYDELTKQIWLGDIGQQDREELNLIKKAGNYQWAYREGFWTGPKAKPKLAIGIDTPPVYDYPHYNNKGCVICGYVYRGRQWAADLEGKLLFGDNTSGKIWTLTFDGTNAPVVTYLCNMPPGENYAGGLSSFGLDHQQEIYMCAMGPKGQIFKLSRAVTTTPEPPRLLSQVGIFPNFPNLSPVSGLIPYDVNMPFWSDQAVKQRWIALPNQGAPYPTNQQISFSPAGEWTFPAGTVLVKHFELPVDDAHPQLRKRLETRLLVRDTNDTVYGVTYKWRPDNTEADLLTNSLSEEIVIATTNGVGRTQTWYYPSRQDCLTCHNFNANYVLGISTRQLNGSFTYSDTGATDNQLRTWNHLGLFNPPLNEADIPAYAALTHITNATTSLEVRVRSYLDANCAYCHRPNGVHANFDARYETPLASQGIVNGPANFDLGISGAKLLAATNPAQSMIYLRLTTLGTNQMPPLGRNTVDFGAAATFKNWINTLTPIGFLPPPWFQQDIGKVGLAGRTTYASATFTLAASGSDIWTNADSFHYAFQPLSGDGQIITRVVSVGQSDEWAKAGLMIRETMNPDSRYAHMCATAAHGPSFQRRLSTAGLSISTKGTNLKPPYWLKLIRQNTTFTGYYSTNGATWKQLDTDNIPMAKNVYVGLAGTSHNNESTNHSIFDHLELDKSSNRNN